MWNWRASGAVTFVMIAEYRRNEAIGVQGKQPREHDHCRRMISV
jgi:hypothetical protein